MKVGEVMADESCSLGKEHSQKFKELEEKVHNIQTEIKLIQQGKANTDSYSELKLMMTVLDNSLKEVIRERKEDSMVIAQLMSDMADIRLSMNTIGVNHEYTIKKMDIVEEKLDQIIKATTFNWLEAFSNFTKDNIIKKFLTYGSVGMLVISIIGIFTWALTGKNIIPTLVEYFNIGSGVAK